MKQMGYRLAGFLACGLVAFAVSSASAVQVDLWDYTRLTTNDVSLYSGDDLIVHSIFQRHGEPVYGNARFFQWSPGFLTTSYMVNTNLATAWELIKPGLTGKTNVTVSIKGTPVFSSGNKTNRAEFGVFARAAVTGAGTGKVINGYAALLARETNGVAYCANLKVVKDFRLLTGGKATYTTLAVDPGLYLFVDTNVVAYTVMLQATGTTITASLWSNATQLASVSTTDSSYASGNAGFFGSVGNQWFYPAYGDLLTPTVKRIDDFDFTYDDGHYLNDFSTNPIVGLELNPSAIQGVMQTYAFQSLTLTNSAIVDCLAQTNAPYWTTNTGVAISLAGNLYVGPDACLNAYGNGFGRAQGPAGGRGGTAALGIAGGHGGIGGLFRDSLGITTNILGGTYGSYTNPTCLGSAGYYSGASAVSLDANVRGGGSIRIATPGDIVVAGTISAGSPTDYSDSDSPGAGGSLWLAANNLLGTGVIEADGGGDIAFNYIHSGGGGGRIAYYVTNDGFTGRISAYGGQGTGPAGGAGTVYRKLPGQTYGDLIVDNGGRSLLGTKADGLAGFVPLVRRTWPTRLGGTNDGGTYNFDNLILQGRGNLEIVGTQTFNIAAATINSGRGDGTGTLTWHAGAGTLAIPSAYTVSNYTLCLDNGTPSGLTDLTIAPSGTVSHTGNLTSETYRLNLSLNSLTVQSGGAIDVSDKGYANSIGPGRGAIGNPRKGSGHGGMGGNEYFNNAIVGAGTTYGSFLTPTNCGSGGCMYKELDGYGATDPGCSTAAGGGIVRLNIATELRVDGTITATALPNPTGVYTARGSGGSIWITASNLTGAGSIRADGGNHLGPYYENAGGGGGRIALYVTNDSSTVTLTAYGGLGKKITYDGEHGAAGTIYRKVGSQAYGELIVDNRGSNTTFAVTRLSTTNDTGSYVFDKLTLRGRAKLEIVGGQSLDASGSTPIVTADASVPSLINSGTFVLPATFSLTNFNLLNNNAASLGSLADLTIATNCMLSHSLNLTSEVNRLNLSLQSLTIQPGGMVSADGCGFMPGKGPGAATNGVLGGTYAGMGTNNIAPPYGDAMSPTNLGSGGWYVSGQAATYAWGGGAIRLKVARTLTVNGSITANGLTNKTATTGSAAGGSIWLDVGTLAGSGRIRADGGYGGPTTAGGGGGRVSITYRRGAFTGLPDPGLYTNRETMSLTVTARGAYRMGVDGVEDGSVYIEKISTGSVFLIY